jgi:hypothetical protein
MMSVTNWYVVTRFSVIDRSLHAAERLGAAAAPSRTAPDVSVRSRHEAPKVGDGGCGSDSTHTALLAAVPRP